MLSELLCVGEGITALVGGGGKTSLMYLLAEELKGNVIVTTSTKIGVPEQYPTLLNPSEDEIRAALKRHRVICVAAPYKGEKLTAPEISFDALAKLAPHVIVEADGSRRLPLKAHETYEPVIPEHAAQVIMTVGADGFGGKIAEVCHRPALYAALAGVSEDAVVTPEIAARVIEKEGFGDIVFLNKVDTEADWEAAKAFAAFCSRPVVAGSLHKGVFQLCAL